MAVRDVGVETEVREVQDKKAYWPIKVMDDGMETEARDEHSKKA
jgi:hypothetical protein